MSDSARPHRRQPTSLCHPLSIYKHLSVHPSLYFYHPSICLSMSVIYLSIYPICLSSYVVAFQPLSRVRLFATPWTIAYQASLSFTNSQRVFKLMSIESVMPSNHLNLYHPLLLLPSIFPSIRVFSKESVLPIRWPKFWNFSFSINPSKEYSRLISLRIDWFDLLTVQGTLKSLQHDNSKASVLSIRPLNCSYPLIHAMC